MASTVAAPTAEQSPDGPLRSPALLAIRWVFPDPAGALTLVRPRALVLGRDADADVVLEDPAVSGRHARLTGDASGAATITDLGSRNGLFVDGKRCQEATLAAGAVVRLGGHIGVVCAVPEPDVAARMFELWKPGLWVGPGLAAALGPARKVALTDLAIVIVGETGTGKDVIARALHEASGRRGPYLAVNCAAIPQALAESTLFGHVRGAFTGADEARGGYFREADGGTLLLDEVSDLALPVQAKLLRTLENREIAPLGHPRPIPVDVRIIAATQRPLEEAVAAGQFRADLFARLNGLVVHVPPLRARREEMPFLFARALEHAAEGPARCTLRAAAVEELLLHDFPYNVRELVLLARKIVALHGDSDAPLSREHVAPYLQRRAEPPIADAGDLRERLLRAVDDHEGNIARAAESVGISRARAYRLLTGVDLEALREQSRKR